MDDPLVIADRDDPRLDDYRGLRDPQRRRIDEERAGIFVAEGITVVERLVAGGVQLRSVLVLETKRHRVERLTASLDVPVYSASRDVLTTVTGFDVHRGVLASAPRPCPPPLPVVLAKARTVVVLEGLNNPENVGSIARSARALGADALIIDPRCSDPFARRTVRVSMGEIVFLPTYRLTPWPDALEELRTHGLAIAALTPDPGTTSLFEWAAPERVALVFGAEGPGLTTSTRQIADVELRIPIRAGVDSLNVGHAAAITLAQLGASRGGATPS